jgi:O-antigen ligase
MSDVSTAPLFFVATAALALTPGAGPLAAPETWISLTAPCFALIGLERLVRRERLQWRAHSVLTLLFLIGCGGSLAVGLWSGESGSIAADEALLLLRFAFWGGVFLLTADLLSRAEWTPKLALGAAAAAIGLALMRLTDGALAGGLQAEGRWLSQNAYGARFSLFVPFLAAAALGARGISALFWSGGLLAVLGVVFLNGSRSAWFTALLGVGLAAAIHGVAGRLRPAGIAVVIGALLFCAALPVWGPPSVRVALQNRIATLGRLDQDKPVRTRQLVVRKGLLMFQAEPWTGRGLGRFSKTDIALATSEEPWLTDRDLNQRSAHNGYIKILAETGLMGFLPLLGLMAWLALRGLPAAVALTRRGESWAAGAYGSFAAVALHLWTLSGLTGTAPWFCFGWVAAMALRHRGEAT